MGPRELIPLFDEALKKGLVINLIKFIGERKRRKGITSFSVAYPFLDSSTDDYGNARVFVEYFTNLVDRGCITISELQPIGKLFPIMGM